jgi:hypothetical protein
LGIQGQFGLHSETLSQKQKASKKQQTKNVHSTVTGYIDFAFFLFFSLFLDTGSCYVSQASLELEIFSSRNELSL